MGQAAVLDFREVPRVRAMAVWVRRFVVRTIPRIPRLVFQRC
jgi:hypothetical protein